LKDRAHHVPAHLSGGEQQRVCIARALINDPNIILADEPTGNLDAQNEQIVLRILKQLHDQGRTIIMVTHDPVVARLADRRVELRHGHIAVQEASLMSDEEQFDEVLEEIWVIQEHGEQAELGQMDVHGDVHVAWAVDKMVELGLLTTSPHPPLAHSHKTVINPCHDALGRISQFSGGDGRSIIEFTPQGKQRATDVIRRHRLSERLFTESLGMKNQEEIEEQACKFEHILSPEATDRICTFLGHPRTCPHGAPVPPGPCCDRARSQHAVESQPERALK
jgi:ABC-type methionine transport system ATPase subunit